MKEEQEIVRLRNHFTYIFEQMWRMLVAFACLLLGSEDSIKLGMELIRNGNIIQGLLAMGGVLLLIIVISLWYVNRWYHTTLTIKDGTVISAKVTLNRRVNTMSIANISNINLEQNLFEMIVGTYKLKLDTNTLSTANQTDLEIVLKKKDAEHVKQLILTMLRELEEEQDVGKKKEEEPSAQEEFDALQGEYDITYSDKEILINGLVTISVSECFLAVGLICSTIAAGVSMGQEKKDVLTIISAMFLQFIAASSIVVDILRRCLQDFHFRAKRCQDKIYVSYGLFKKKSYVVPVDKINAVTLKYTFISRLCRKAYVKVINIGGQGEEADGMKLLLADSYEGLGSKLQMLLPEFQLPETDRLMRPPKRLMGLYRLHAFFNAMIATVLCVVTYPLFEEERIGGSVLLISGLVGVAAGCLNLYISYMRYRASGILYGESNFIISRGVFAKTVQTVPYGRIQFIHLRQGPFMRKMGLLGGEVSILASAASQTQQIGVFGSNDFERLEERLRETY